MTGIEVKEWREARDISQKRLAKLLPMNLTTLQGWERAEPRGAPPPFMRRALGDLERELQTLADVQAGDMITTREAQPIMTPVGIAHVPLNFPTEREAARASEPVHDDDPVREPSYELDDQQPLEIEGEFEPRTHAGRRAAK